MKQDSVKSSRVENILGYNSSTIPKPNQANQILGKPHVNPDKVIRSIDMISSTDVNSRKLGQFGRESTLIGQG